MDIINHICKSPLVGKNIYYSYKEQITKGYDVGSYYETIEHEKTGVVTAIGTDAKGEFHVLVIDDEGMLESFPIKKMEVIKIIKKPLPEKEIPREELIDLD